MFTNHTNESKRKLSKALKGKPWSEARRQAQRNKVGLIGRLCRECHSFFKIKKSQAKPGSGMYCSYACKVVGAGKTHSKGAEQRRIEKECKICQRKVFIKPSHGNKEGTYCSKGCMSAGYSILMVGRGNPNYRHGLSDKGIHVVRRKNAPGRHSIKDISRLLSRQRNECAYCGTCLLKGYDIDHITPITKNGSNYIGNIQILCQSCNRRKNNKLFSEFRYYAN